MTAFWMTLNFVLLLLAFYLILHLYQRIQILQKKDPNSSDTQLLLDEHMAAVRQENEQLLAELRTLLKEQDAKKPRTKRTRKPSPTNKEAHEVPSEENSNLEKKDFSAMLSEETERNKPNAKSVNKSRITSKPESPGTDEWMPPIDQVQDKIEESPYIQALKLKEKGLTATEIAKQLHRGKGEIELLLKLKGKVQS
ncbi:hypothetical protein ACFP7A_02575 [Sporolactobacillus kofuensis]|uniref:Swarming motility protein SwrB n=1 Tax=Sporolactobacillus kofuensis TaxID=269672 RepID=A0ABW1WE83_9BACL|nr:hypothetical protein [Sporolactobacillus kofuensis]MCO7174716.1 hypothetical protein [Sporolactobacillus kofuensis]